MNILFKGNILIEDVVITSAAEHEEELMKSDFVKLSWEDSVCQTLPVGAYILIGDTPYSLLKPYTPEQKSDIQWHYEPQFQHPKMYLGCVTFQNPVTDTLDNDVDLIDWPYTGFLRPLLGYFCSAMDKALDFEEGTFGATIIDEANIESMVTAQFNVQDILSALSNVANSLSCEWHIDWYNKMLYFGHISYLSNDEVIPVLKVGDNIQMSSRRDTKDKYFNVIQPQGSTRNLTRVAVSGENVQATVRLALDENVPYHINDTDYPNGVTTPGRKIYTDGNGNAITKADFDIQGEKEFFKSVVFEEIYPRQDAYIYNIRYRERYLLDDNGNKIEETRNPETGEVTYKRYAIWYMRIAIPQGLTPSGEATGWDDYRVSQECVCVVTDRWQTMGYPDNQYNRIVIKTNLEAGSSAFKHLIDDETGLWQVNYDLAIVELNGIKVYARWHTEWEGYNDTITLTVDARDNEEFDNFKGYDAVYSVTAEIRGGVYIGKCNLWDHPEDWDRERWTQFLLACQHDEVIIFREGVNINNYPDKNKRGNVIDGKNPIAAFQVNTRENALNSSLAGRGNGDGDGHYGFKLKFLEDKTNEGREYIEEANEQPTEDGDTGIVDMDGHRATVGDGDFEIIYEEGDVILPSTLSLGLIPRGYNTQSLLNNKINIYNVVLDDSFEETAKEELAQEAIKYAKKECEDNTNYTFKTDQVSFYANDPGLFIGRKVIFIDGGGNSLDTRVIKLVTKLDFSFEKEITVGNAVIKSNASQLQDKVDALVAGGTQSGGSGGGVSPQMVKNLIKEYTDPRFLSKINDDTARGNIRIMGGMNVGTGNKGMDSEGDIEARDITAETIDAEEATIDEIESHDFEHGIDTGRGWKIDRYGNAELESATIRSFLEVIELLVNRIQAQEGDTIFSDNDQIEHVTRHVSENNEVTYILDLKEKWDGYVTPQMYGNIVKGIINTLAAKEAGVSDYTSDTTGQSRDNGGNLYYTSWMQVVNTHNTDNRLGLNQIEVVLYGDTEVPAQRNFEPCAMMVIARRGCVDYSDPDDPDYNTVKQSIIRRQRFFEISASDGRVTKFTGVDHPLLTNPNYGVTIGELPDFVKRYPDVQAVLEQVGEHTDWLYAQGVVYQNLVHIDREGLPVPITVFCGDWVDGSSVQHPLPCYGIYFYNEYNESSQQFENHEVRHMSGRWQCLQHQPVRQGGVDVYYEPRWNSPYWRLVDGNDNLSIEFVSSNGYSFRRGFIDTVITAHLFFGNVDITDDVEAEFWTWTRQSESGKTEADYTWDAQHAGVKTLHLTDNDMPATWSYQDKAIFTCSVTVNDGKTTRIVDNQIIS